MNLEWSRQGTKFTKVDTNNFGFHKDYKSFEVRTIKITKPQGEECPLKFEDEILDSEEKYRRWIETNQPSLAKTRIPTLILVMHPMLGDDEEEPTELPYGKKMFLYACENLFQHRSVTHTLPRKTTVIFNHRSVNWGPKSPGHSTVYNCVSDTEALNGDGSIVLSTTCFTAIPLTYGVFYGCNAATMKNIVCWLDPKNCGESWTHPLMLPMVFIELERKRLLNAGEDRGSSLRQRLLDMEKKSSNHGKKNQQEGRQQSAMSTGDSETIKMLLSMSELKNGLEGLLTQLSSMRDHLGKPSEITVGYKEAETDRGITDSCGVNIDLRLKEMMMELQSKLRTYEGLLETTTLATQMEATDLTRFDSWVNFGISRSTMRDSTHMRIISIMGMFFLPGTFLATLFSTTFFNWTPSSDKKIISPWIVLYFGLTAITTVFTIVCWNRRRMQDERDLKLQFMKDVEGAREWLDEAGSLRSSSRDSADVTDDLESGNAGGIELQLRGM